MTAPQPTDPELDALYAEYNKLKPTFDELKERFEAVKQAIKVKLTAANPGQTRIDIDHPALAAPLKLIYVPRWDLNTKRMKAEDPELYVRYAEKGGRWELRPA